MCYNVHVASSCPGARVESRSVFFIHTFSIEGYSHKNQSVWAQLRGQDRPCQGHNRDLRAQCEASGGPGAKTSRWILLMIVDRHFCWTCPKQKWNPPNKTGGWQFCPNSAISCLTHPPANDLGTAWTQNETITKGPKPACFNWFVAARARLKGIFFWNFRSFQTSQDAVATQAETSFW